MFREGIHAARSENWRLPFPSDVRLNAWLDCVRLSQLAPRLSQLAPQVGACGHTINRDIGMNYQHWRQQWRLLKAMVMLADGQTAQAGGAAAEICQRQCIYYFLS